MDNEYFAPLRRFLDDEGRLKQWPGKQAMKALAVEYLATKVQRGCDYTETDINGLVNRWHTFGDFFLLRRSLVEYGYLRRERDGSRYWANEEKHPGEAE